MPKWASSNMLDNGPAYLKANGSQMLLLKAYAAGDSYATVTGNAVANVAMAAGDYTLSSSGSNRQLQTAAGKSSNASASSQQYDSGTASGGSATTLVDATKAWAANVHANRAVHITSGTGAGQRGRVASNTGTTLTFAAGTFATAPDATSVYTISDDLHFAFTDGAANVIYVTDETSDQVITSGNPISWPQLTYTSNQPN